MSGTAPAHAPEPAAHAAETAAAPAAHAEVNGENIVSKLIGGFRTAIEKAISLIGEVPAVFGKAIKSFGKWIGGSTESAPAPAAAR